MTRPIKQGCAAESARWFALVAALAAAPAACDQTGAAPLVVAVTPGRAFTDGPTFLRVDVQGLRPSLRVQVGQGHLSADLTSLKASLVPDGKGSQDAVRLKTADWDGHDAYWFETPARLAPGQFAMELVDPRGQVLRWPEAFESLGQDPTPPTISVSSFASAGYLQAGGSVTTQIDADDGITGALSRIDWQTSDGSSGTCTPTKADGAPTDLRDVPPEQLTCIATFQTPVLGRDDPTVEPFSFTATAQDVAGHVATLEIPLQVAKAPSIASFSGKVGALGGFQPFVINGQNFLPGTQAFIGGVPIVGMKVGGDRQNDQSIVGWTPPHDRAEGVVVEVRSPAGQAQSPLALFTYSAPPRPRDIQPPSGPARGGIRVTVKGNDLRTGAVVYIGATREVRLPLYNVTYDAQDKVVGCLPPGSGTASVWIYDPVTGDGELANAFNYELSSPGPPPASDPACQ